MGKKKQAVGMHLFFYYLVHKCLLIPNIFHEVSDMDLAAILAFSVRVAMSPLLQEKDAASFPEEIISQLMIFTEKFAKAVENHNCCSFFGMEQLIIVEVYISLTGQVTFFQVRLYDRKGNIPHRIIEIIFSKVGSLTHLFLPMCYESFPPDPSAFFKAVKCQCKKISRISLHAL